MTPSAPPPRAPGKAWRLPFGLRPVDLLPLAFLGTVGIGAALSPYPMPWDAATLGAWAVVTALAAGVIAVPSLVRVGRGFFEPRWSNLPGHALLIALVVAAVTVAPDKLLHPGVWAVAALMLGLSATLGRRKAELFTVRRLALAWLPALLSFFVYENLRALIGAINPAVADDALAALDLRLFGVHLSVVMEAWQSPALTAWMSFHYGLYLAYPVVTGTLFYYGERRAAFEDFILAFCLSMYAGFLCYLAVPAVGPLSALRDLYHTSLIDGVPYAQYQHAFMEKYRYTRDAFPSLHVANSLLCVLAMARQRARLAWGMAFFEANLILATLYLRMHYAIDVVAGIALAGAVHWAAPRINARFGVPADRAQAQGAAGSRTSSTA